MLAILPAVRVPQDPHWRGLSMVQYKGPIRYLDAVGRYSRSLEEWARTGSQIPESQQLLELGFTVKVPLERCRAPAWGHCIDGRTLRQPFRRYRPRSTRMRSS